MNKPVAEEMFSKKTTDSFVNFVSRLGINPAHPQNTLTAGHYNFNLLTRNRIQLEAAYRGSWIVGQVVDAVAEDMTRSGIDITTSDGADDIKGLNTAMSRLCIWQSMASLIKWSRLYGGAIAVIQIEGQELDTPLNLDSIGKKQFKGLGVYDRWQLNPDLTQLIDRGSDIGLPMYYSIVTGLKSGDASATGTANKQIKVHNTRCIRMIGIELPYMQAITEMMWGESVLERFWDRLISFDDATLAAANLIDRAQLRTVKIEGLRTIISSGGDAYDGLIQMFELVRQFQTNEGLTLLDKNDDFETTSYTFAGLPEVLLQFAQQLSGASKIPLIRLFGQPPSGLSATGDSDIRLYYDNINAEQESKMRNPFEVLIQIIYRSVYGRPAPDDLEFSFTPLWQMTAVDKATVCKMNAETIIAAHDQGGIDTQTMMRELRDACGNHGIFSNITDEMIEEALNEEPPMPSATGEPVDPANPLPQVPEAAKAPAVKSIE